MTPGTLKGGFGPLCYETRLGEGGVLGLKKGLGGHIVDRDPVGRRGGGGGAQGSRREEAEGLAMSLKEVEIRGVLEREGPVLGGAAEP